MKKILSILMLLFTLVTFGQTTWNGTSWSSGVPTDNVNAIINANYDTNIHGSFICKNLTINSGFQIIIGPNDSVTIGNGGNGVGSLTNNSGSVIVQDGGSLFQLGNTNNNTGTVTIQRRTNPVKLNDYTYWSSPVSNQLYNNLPPAPTTNLNVYSYSNTTTNYGWGNNLVSTNGTMDIGRGYIARKYIVNDTNPQQVYIMNFVGVPNKGDISINLTSFIGFRPNVGNLDGSIYLTGNPYPCALDIDRFLTVNNSSAIYLWTHNTSPSISIPGSELYNYTPDDYATYNLTGGVAASSPAPSGNSGNNDNAPTRYIGSGQGFFVKAPILGSKTFNFNDSMINSTTDNSQFYRQYQPQTVEKHRIWLFLTNNFNISRYNMVGYVTDATNGFDHQYDAVMADGRVAAIYSILDDKDLTIQGKSLPFNNQDIIPLGYKLPEGGSFQIGLNDVDGLFTDVSQPIYLEDLELGVIHNLRNSNYSFTATTGTNETRFRLRFTNTTLGNDDFTLDNTSIYSYNGQVNVKSNQSIKDIYVYDMLGRVVNQFNNINSNDKSFTLNNDGIYIVKVKLENDAIITKKIAN